MKLKLALLGAGLMAASTSTAQTTSQDPFCYTRCQYECYVIHPGGGDAWRACYIACAAEKCSSA
jgi:hypothetical protein